jgi:GNAT superfamily N-acetyltransferase
MGITQWDKEDQGVFDGCLAVDRAAWQADDPDGPPRSARTLRVMLTGIAGSGGTETWCETDGAEVHGWYRLYLPSRENLDSGSLELVVAPGQRRRGLGTELLRHAAGRAAEQGRSRLLGEPLQASGMAEFAKAVGAQAGVPEGRRFLHVAEIPPGRIAGLRARAASAATGYSVLSWAGAVPDEHLDGAAYVREAMNDAPSEPEDDYVRWDARRVREQLNPRIEAYGNRFYTIAAVHDETGQMAALTDFSVDPEFPEWGFQQMTAVARPHRGHRLGLLVKSAMLEWLATTEPGLRTIFTGNSDSNGHMIAINEQLGYQQVHPGWQAQRLDIAAFLSR